MGNIFNDNISKVIKDLKSDLNNLVEEEQKNITDDASFIATCQPATVEKLVYMGILDRPGCVKSNRDNHLIDISVIALDYPELPALNLMMVQHALEDSSDIYTYERIIECCREKIRQITEKKYQESLTNPF